MISGRSTQTIAANEDEAKKGSMSANARTDDIVKSAMKDAGLQL